MTRRDLLAAALVVMALAAACGKSEPARTPAGGKVSCTSDSDCVVTTSSGCCACCPDAPHAVPRAAADKQTAICATAQCEACAQGISCPAAAEPPSAFTAACKDGTCAALHK